MSMIATKPAMRALPQTGERHLGRREPLELVDELQEEMVRAWGEAWPLLSLRLRRLTLAPKWPSSSCWACPGGRSGRFS